jgi:ABC-type xylose transport system permease subunit
MSPNRYVVIFPPVDHVLYLPRRSGVALAAANANNTVAPFGARLVIIALAFLLSFAGVTMPVASCPVPTLFLRARKLRRRSHRCDLESRSRWLEARPAGHRGS